MISTFWVRKDLELRLVSWKQSSEYPGMDKRWENTYQQIHGDVRNVLCTQWKIPYLVQKHGLSLCWNTGVSAVLFSRFWDITVSYSSSHQMYTHNYNSGINDTRLSFMFLYLCHFFLYDIYLISYHLRFTWILCCSWVEKATTSAKSVLY